MPLAAATRAKWGPNLLSRSRMRSFGDCPYGVASRSCWAVQASVGERGDSWTPTCMTLRECISIMKKACQRAKEEVCNLQGITRPDVFGMIPQEGSPVLPYSSRCESMPHILLNGTFRDRNAQLEEFTTNTLSSPKAILHCHLLDQRHGLCGDLWFGRCCSRLVFPVQL